MVKAFVVGSHKGTIRTTNEDRISIVVNANNNFKQHANINNMIKYSNVYSIIDGHGGNFCCEYLKKYLHEKIFEIFNLNNLIIP